MKQMIGHTLFDQEGKLLSIETLSEHLVRTAVLAERFLAGAGVGLLGRLVALAHDMGKASDRFAKRVGVMKKDDAEPIHYNHMMHGAKYVLSLFGYNTVGKMLAIVIACHHGGLRNWSRKPSEDHAECKHIQRDETFNNMLAEYEKDCLAHPDGVPYPEVDDLVQDLSEGCFNIDPKNFGKSAIGADIFRGYWAMLTRLLFSGIVDGDCLATEAFYDKTAPKRRHNKHDDLYTLRTKLADHIRKVCKDDTPINKWRTRVMERSKSAAVRAKGVFTLEADVGGGKTLAMLHFALSHALNHGLVRIVYVAPYGAIIEQTANTLRKIFGSHNVCVHHINMDPTNTTPEALLACDNWDAPIIVSSVEQLFDSLYSNKNARCRKLHNLINSVVLIDEFHDIPLTKMYPALHAVDALVSVFKSSVVLSSATLPVLDTLTTYSELNGEVNKLLAHRPKSIVPVEDFAASVQRVKEIYDPNIGGSGNWDSVAEAAGKHDRCMVVVNTRASAFELARVMKEKGIRDVYHLSASMVPALRDKVLAKVMKRLADKQPVKLVCTSIVQTGVDISFPVVYREMCGQDSYRQAGGRCNRNFEDEVGYCILFPQTGDIVPGLPMYKTQAFKTLLDRNGGDPSSVNIQAYWAKFIEVYHRELDKKEKRGITEPAFDNKDVLRYELDESHFSFETIAANAKIIDDGQQSLMVLCDESKSVIEKMERFAKLSSENALSGLSPAERLRALPTKEDRRMAQRFTVMAYGDDSRDENEKKYLLFPWLVEVGLAHKLSNMDNVYVLDKGYDPEYGIAPLIDQFVTARRNQR